MPDVAFPGFERNYLKNFFIYPNALTAYWSRISGSEQKILDFTLRMTIGWRKTCDRISLSQFANGVGEINKGTGLSISQIRRALKRLEELGIITVTRYKRSPSNICLVLEHIDYFKEVDKKAFSAFLKDFEDKK